MKVSWMSSIPDHRLLMQAAGNARLAGVAQRTPHLPLERRGGVWYELVGNPGRSAVPREYHV